MRVSAVLDPPGTETFDITLDKRHKWKEKGKRAMPFWGGGLLFHSHSLNKVNVSIIFLQHESGPGYFSFVIDKKKPNKLW